MKIRKILTVIIFALLIPATVVAGMTLFERQKYSFFITAVAILSVLPVILSLEKKESDAKKLVLIAVMTSLSVVSRILFEWFPHFKPVTAFVIITGIYLGKEAGFLCGAFSALISNFVFGQGSWTPFQMMTWGLIGLFAALFGKILSKNIALCCVFGALSGVLYSMLMDVYTVLWVDPDFSFTRYIAAITTAIPTTVSYVVSNVLFLLFLLKPIGKKIERIKQKYGIE